MTSNDDTSARPMYAEADDEWAWLSPYQERFWLLRQLAPDVAGGVATAWRIRGPLRTDVLRRALRLLVDRHESLRIRIDAAGGIPRQVVTPPADVSLPVLDYSAIAPSVKHEAVAEAISELCELPFDLSKGQVQRFMLVKLSDDEHVLVRHTHQIATDEWSERVLDDELSGAYNALCDDLAWPPAPPGPSYIEHARRYHEQFDGQAWEDKLRYWARTLSDLPILEFPSDRPRPLTPERCWGSAGRELPSPVADQARELAAHHGACLYQVLAASVAVVLCRCTGNDDFAIGMPVSGRRDAGPGDLVGCLTTVAPLRVDLSGNPSFAALLGQLTTTAAEISEHADVPFHLIVDRVRPIRAAGLNPLYQICVRLSDPVGDAAHAGGLALRGLACEPYQGPTQASGLDIVLEFTTQVRCSRLVAEYSMDLFDRWRIDALLGHIANVLKAAIADPSLRVFELPVISDAQRRELLSLGTGEPADYTSDPLHVTFTKTARRQPNAVAVVCRGAELSYSELDRRSNLLGHYLRSLRPGPVVAVVIDRCLAAYVAMIGVLKAGCGYAMMDPNVPPARLDYMIADAGATVVLTRAGLANRLPESSGRTVVCLDADWPTIEATATDEPLGDDVSNDTLAYIIFTSGSTGAPKGVLVKHRPVASFCVAYRRSFDFGPQDRLLQLPALNFDMSQGEIWTAFLVGATLVAVAPEEAAVPESVSELMRAQRVTYAGLSLAMQAAMDAAPYPALRYIMGGAEALVPDLVNKWNLPGRRYLNLYGPTEGTIAQTEYIVDHVEWKSSPPIGRPMANRRVYIVDRWDNLAPIGVNGELLIGGAEGTLASGYLNQPAETQAKFVRDPFRPTGQVYRSGDLVRWNCAGQIEFIGRIDNQVNLGGHRVELGEIEDAVHSHPDIARAVVLMRRDGRGKDRLICYFTSKSDEPTIADLRRHLGGWLQEYVIPTAWVPLERFPMNATRTKIDRNALPDPVDADFGDDEELTGSQARVAACFAEVLSLPSVGSHDSFFTLGGNSTGVVRLVSLINERFDVGLTSAHVFAYPTVDGLADFVDRLIPKIQAARREWP